MFERSINRASRISAWILHSLTIIEVVSHVHHIGSQTNSGHFYPFCSICIQGLDVEPTGYRFGSSLPLEWALNPDNDVILAFEMNGQPLTPDHGYPLRLVVPGTIGARQVKWLKRIALSGEESTSFWLRNDYKLAFPSADGTIPKTDHLPTVLDYPVQSAICEPEDGQIVQRADKITLKGYAYSGGGRGIFSVRLSTDDGQTWHEAKLYPTSPGGPTSIYHGKDPGMEHRNSRQWAWTLWTVDLPVPKGAKELEVVCMAMDSAYNKQPRDCSSSLNVRGLLANPWHRIKVKIGN